MKNPHLFHYDAVAGIVQHKSERKRWGYSTAQHLYASFLLAMVRGFTIGAESYCKAYICCIG